MRAQGGQPESSDLVGQRGRPGTVIISPANRMSYARPMSNEWQLWAPLRTENRAGALARPLCNRHLSHCWAARVAKWTQRTYAFTLWRATQSRHYAAHSGTRAVARAVHPPVYCTPWPLPPRHTAGGRGPVAGRTLSFRYASRSAPTAAASRQARAPNPSLHMHPWPHHITEDGNRAAWRGRGETKVASRQRWLHRQRCNALPKAAHFVQWPAL